VVGRNVETTFVFESRQIAFNKVSARTRYMDGNPTVHVGLQAPDQELRYEHKRRIAKQSIEADPEIAHHVPSYGSS
jgi:hypothetical protein